MIVVGGIRHRTAALRHGVDRRAEFAPLMVGLTPRRRLIPPTGNASGYSALGKYLILHVYFDTDRDLASVARCTRATTTNWVPSERGGHFPPGQKGNHHLQAAGAGVQIIPQVYDK